MGDKLEWWGAVASDGDHIRAVVKASNKENAELLLMQGWTDQLKALYVIKRVVVAVAESDNL